MGVVNLEALTRPFSPDQVKQRQGRGGITLDYLEAHTVISRLNESFDGAWSFEVLEHRILDDEVVVHGQLTAGGVTKAQFGGSEISRLRDSGKPVSISDDLKAAASDCIKKCATLFGVGLQFYGGKNGEIERPTEAQLDRIDELAKSFAISDDDRKALEENLPKLTRSEADDVITFLELKIQAAGENGKKKGKSRTRAKAADGKPDNKAPEPDPPTTPAASGNGQGQDDDGEPAATDKQRGLIEKTVKDNAALLTDKEARHIRALLDSKLSRKKASEVLDFLLGQSAKNPLTGAYERVSQGMIDQRRQARKAA